MVAASDIVSGLISRWSNCDIVVRNTLYNDYHYCINHNMTVSNRSTRLLDAHIDSPWQMNISLGVICHYANLSVRIHSAIVCGQHYDSVIISISLTVCFMGLGDHTVKQMVWRLLRTCYLKRLCFIVNWTPRIELNRTLKQIQYISFNKMSLQMASAKWWPFWPSNMINLNPNAMLKVMSVSLVNSRNNVIDLW